VSNRLALIDRLLDSQKPIPTNVRLALLALGTTQVTGLSSQQQQNVIYNNVAPDHLNSRGQRVLLGVIKFVLLETILGQDCVNLLLRVCHRLRN
jgi:hypothetical protein